MTVLKASLFGQAIWFLCAAVYNGLSLLAIAGGDTGFAGDAATTQSAMVGAAIFGVVTLSGLVGQMAIYKVLAPVVLVALLVGGVVKHVSLGPQGYASEITWIVAILINSFGVAAYAVGTFAAFRHK